MPNAILNPKTGLYVPRSTFPALLPVTGSQQVEGIAPYVQPVMVVSPYTITSTPSPTPGGVTPVSPPPVPAIGISALAGSTIWNPTGTATVVANLNAGTRYQAVIPAGWAVMLEEIHLTFATEAGYAAANAGKEVFAIYLSPAQNAVPLAATAFHNPDSRYWAYGYRASAVADSTEYVVSAKRGAAQATLAENENWISNASRTNLISFTLPDLIMTQDGSLSVVFQAAAGATEKLDNVSVEALLSWYKFA